MSRFFTSFLFLFRDSGYVGDKKGGGDGFTSIYMRKYYFPKFMLFLFYNNLFETNDPTDTEK